MAISLLKTIYENSEELVSEVQLLLSNGADPNIITNYGESALRVASNNGRLDVVKVLLENNANEEQLGWTKLFHSIAFGNVQSVNEALQSGCDLEARDYWERTPLLFSILVGDPAKTEILLNAGSNKEAAGKCGRPAMTYAVLNDHAAMLSFLALNGFDAEQSDDFGLTPLMTAAELGSIKCVKALIDMGVNIFAENDTNTQAIFDAKTLEVVISLIQAGADPNDIDKENKALLLGYEVNMPLNASKEQYRKGKERVFGKSNPELMDKPFWMEMIKFGKSAFDAAKKLDRKRDIYAESPIWCYERFGKSFTPLSDGRTIEIGGEHEDSYDPDFCIYNEVFVHNGKGHCDIYGYPREVFPPTDFHTATLVEDQIYIIGSLGYYEERKPDYTPVYCLNLKNYEINKLETSGIMPGWISNHKARFDGKANILISGGKLVVKQNGEQDFIENRNTFSLCLTLNEWKKVEK